jgi:hypothetical protein
MATEIPCPDPGEVPVILSDPRMFARIGRESAVLTSHLAAVRLRKDEAPAS